ncbi:MAG: CHAT domain-containing protein [Lewinellaceae bacterium]|nr:CHAT domain-containing protein [Lewinellaceae bacterium]
MLLLLWLCPVFLGGQACDSLNALAEQYFNERNDDAFFSTAQVAKINCEKEFGKSSIEYVEALQNYGVALSRQSRYQEAALVLEEALQLVQPYKERDLALYGSALNNLGMAYRDLGLYDQALASYLRSLAVIEKESDKNEENAISRGLTLLNLGDLYPGLGYHEKALDCYEEALSVFEAAAGKDHFFYGLAMQKLASFYKQAKIYEQALEYALAARDHFLQLQGNTHPGLAARLQALGQIYERMEQHEKAVEQYEKAKQLTESHFGKNNRAYASDAHSLANGYKHLKKFDKALELSLESLEILEKLLGKDHPVYGSWMNDLASVYFAQKQYAITDSLMEIALANNKKHFGPKHRQRFHLTYNYGTLCDKTGNYTAAFQYYREANAVLHDEIARYFGVLNEAQRENFLFALQENFRRFQYFTFKAKKTTPQAQAMIYDDALALKGLLLQNSENVLAAIRNNPDTSLARLYDTWIGQRELIAAQHSLPLAARAYSPTGLDSLERAAGTLERQLASGSRAFRRARRKVDWQEVQQALREGEAAIEFLAFPHLEAEEKDSVLYCALVLRPGFEFPKLIYLFEEQELSRRLSREVYPTQKYVHELYTPELYQLIWQPLEEALEGAQTVYYAPVGLLHRIAFPAIQDGASRLLADRHQLEYLSSTRRLAEEKPQRTPWSTASLFGGIAYDSLSAEIPLAAPGARRGQQEDQEEGRGWDRIDDPGRSASFSSLAYTRQEVLEIDGLLRRKGIGSRAFLEGEATEEQFKSLARQGRSPDVLHLATHGYFFDDDSRRTAPDSTSANNARELLRRAINPLQRSGLALAGANQAWQEGRFAPGREDGILTALEISGLDLSDTQLAVLSACQTGLGDIRGSEGVYGLQRAFKTAGVDYLLLTLWNIRDGEETVEFMTAFYEKCLAGLPIRQAFREVQGEMRKKYVDPYFWAGFVLVE